MSEELTENLPGHGLSRILACLDSIDGRLDGTDKRLDGVDQLDGGYCSFIRADMRRLNVRVANLERFRERKTAFTMRLSF